MKRMFILFTVGLFLSSCTNNRIEQLESENALLKITIDSLNIELVRVQNEVEMQRSIAERQAEIAMQEAMRARIAEDSAMASAKRLKKRSD